MQGSDFIVLAIVGAATFFAGFQTGRLSASKDRPAGRSGEAPTPISMPDLPDTGEATAFPQPRPRTSAPPPASAGGSGHEQASAEPRPGATAAPRRSSAPPPAAAGLMDKGSPGKDRGS